MTLLTCLLSASFLYFHGLTFAIIVDTKVQIQEGGDGFQGGKIVDGWRAGKYPVS